MGNIESGLGNDSNALEAVKLMKAEADRIISKRDPTCDTRKLLHSYLAHVVPYILKRDFVNGVEKVLLDEEKWNVLIERPLGFFLCGEEPAQGLEKIKQLNSPPQFCGKVFNIGDPTYTCKDCAADPTCVFCHECFNKSVHINHKYRMHTSSGNGGYCDCGDVEAWKKDPCCETHLQGSNYESDKDPKELLPEEILKRATFLYKELLQYCVDMILWIDNDSLPEELRRRSKTDGDLYLCMLYNDEVHTYDQVIRTLQQAVSCDKSEAIRYATIVDKEGRSLVFAGTKEGCEAVCKVIKTRTSRDGRGPLKCEAMQNDIIAHQVAAIEMLSLLNKFTVCSDGLRRLLCELTLNPIPPRLESLLNQLFRSDTDLWKVARGGCHQLFMNAVLLDPYGKKEFAKSFAKAYKVIMNDFIEDDHDHGISASSMSVQIFTVPTLARMLTLEHDILEVVFQTFIGHLENAFTVAGHIDFQNGRDGKTHSLKREYYILHDIGYLLCHKPDQWNPDLRAKFVRAFDVFARILRGMQGMEPVVRKLASHIEYEPNWETGFVMQLWMMPVIESMISWCTSDREVLQEIMKKCLSVLYKQMPALKIYPMEHPELRTDLDLVSYDVSTQPASVHMGLSRFIAGLLAGCTKNSTSLKTLLGLVGSHDRDRQLLALIEYPLRSLVFAAQVSAGMWKRNGYAVLNQVLHYQNVRCVSEMYDKDIMMLQAVAALMDSNHFLAAILGKYGLLDWLKFNYDISKLDEDTQRKTVVISEECLLTILAVLGERHVLGIGQVSGKDILRKEVVHRLALGPASRSEVVKNLPSKDPDDESCTFESLLDDVLTSVSDFREPGLTGKGLYQLKPNCLEECSQYFYHYSRSEQSKALEQRRKETKKGSSSTGYKVPVPAAFTCDYSPVTNLFSCDLMEKILSVVLYRATHAGSKITPDTLIEEKIELRAQNVLFLMDHSFKALYIVALGIFEEKRRREEHDNRKQGRSFLEMITSHSGAATDERLTIRALLEEMQSKCKEQEYSELVDWVLKLIYEELSHKNDATDSANQPNKRKQDEIDSKAIADKERRQRLAREKREKVMAQMSQMQKSFIKKYEDVLNLEETSKDTEDADISDSLDMIEVDSIAVGPSRKHPKLKTDNVICILCQEKQDITAEGQSIVMTAFLQRSKVLSLSKGKNLNDVTDYNPLYTPRDLFTGVYTNTCGHVMHGDCWQKYFDAVKDREGPQLLRLHFHPRIDVNKNEYLCPLCSALCNTVIPLLPGLEHKEPTSGTQEMETDEDPLFPDVLMIELRRRLDCAAGGLFNKVSTASPPRLRTSLSSSFRAFFETLMHGGYHFSNGAQDMMQRFSSAVTNVGLKNPADLESSELIMAWNSCSYTIQAIECLLREEKKALFELTSRQTECLSALVRYSVMGGSVADGAEIERDCLKLLAVLIPNDVPEIDLPCILDLNIFGIMLNLRFAMQSLSFPDSNLAMSDLLSNGTIDQFVLNISVQALLSQLLLLAPEDIEDAEDSFTHIVSENVKTCLADLWGKMKYCAKVTSSATPHKQPDKLYNHVIQQCLPFLRSAALFFHSLTGVQAPTLLLQRDGDDHHRNVRELHAVCKYLSLPADVVSILPLLLNCEMESSMTEVMIERWCKHSSVKEHLTSSKLNFLSSIPAPVKLIPLPKAYSALITTSSGFRCPMTGDISQNPTICLICGEMLCSQSYCCQALVDERQIGSCTAHAEKCNETVGIFLRVRDCQILLLYNKTRGCFIPSPYLDEYGEPDLKFRRGNPLYLSVDRYNNLQKLWLSHEIPEKIVRQLESSRSFMSFDWPQY